MERDLKPRRRHGRPKPRFREDGTGQLDPLRGCPEEMVPADHFARKVRAWAEALDTSTLEAGYSSLGRRGIHPHNVLAVWLCASRIGLHAATQVEKALETDHAFWLVAGGHTMKATLQRTFRRTHGAFFAQAVEQTLKMAQEQGVLDPKALAVDSVRLRADASKASIRTEKRSTARLKSLAQVDTAVVPVCVSLVATPTGIRILAVWVPLPAAETPSGPVEAVLLLYPV